MISKSPSLPLELNARNRLTRLPGAHDTRNHEFCGSKRRPRLGTTHAITRLRADVLVVVEDVAGVVRGLHVRQPVVDGAAVRLADAAGILVAAEEVDVDAFPEPAE